MVSQQELSLDMDTTVRTIVMMQKVRKGRNIETYVLHIPDPTKAKGQDCPSNAVYRGHPQGHRAGQRGMRKEQNCGG